MYINKKRKKKGSFMKNLLTSITIEALESASAGAEKAQIVEVQKELATRKIDLLEAFPTAKGVGLQIYFSSSASGYYKPYTYREASFLNLGNYARMSRILITLLDDSGRPIAVMPFIDFVESEKEA